MALRSGAEFIKIINPNMLISLPEARKVEKITALFADAVKAKTAIIILDDIDGLIELTHVGPNVVFSHALYHAVSTMLRSSQPASAQLLVIGTSCNAEALNLANLFTVQLTVPMLEAGDIRMVISGRSVYSLSGDPFHFPLGFKLPMRSLLAAIDHARFKHNVDGRETVLLSQQELDEVLSVFTQPQRETASANSTFAYDANTYPSSFRAGKP